MIKGEEGGRTVAHVVCLAVVVRYEGHGVVCGDVFRVGFHEFWIWIVGDVRRAEGGGRAEDVPRTWPHSEAMVRGISYTAIVKAVGYFVRVGFTPYQSGEKQVRGTYRTPCRVPP